MPEGAFRGHPHREPGDSSGSAIIQAFEGLPQYPGYQGYGLQRLQKHFHHKDQRPEFCDCVADHVAEQYADEPIARIEVYQKYNNRAIGKCAR